MKNFLLILSLVLLLILSVPSETLSQAKEKDFRKEYYKTLHWDNGLSAKDYVEQFQYIKKMRSYSEIKSRDVVQSQNSWQALGPKQVKFPNNNEIVNHGRIRCFKWFEDANDGWVPIIGASSGGIWYGDFALLIRNWQSLGNNLPNPAIGAIEMRPGSKQRIFVGTGDWGRYNGAGLYLTNDNGATWERRILKDSSGNEIIPNAITNIFYSKGSGFKDMFLSSSSGLFKSTDGGTSWIRITIVNNTPNAGIFSLVQDPQNTNILYAALPGRGVYKSSNGGSTWTKVVNFNVDTGTTLALDISQSDPDILYLSVPDKDNNTLGIYKTTQGFAYGSTKLVSQHQYMYGGQGFHANIIKINPDNPDIVYAGGVELIATTNGGDTWQTRDGGHADYTSISFHPSNSNYVYIGNDGGIFVYNEQTKQVTNKAEFFQPVAPIQAYEIESDDNDPSMVLVGTQDNGTMLSKNVYNAYSWENIFGCDGGNNINILPSNTNTIIFNSWCGDRNPRLRTFNKGLNVEDFSPKMKELYYTPIRINKYYTNYVFTVDDKYLYYSTNNGTEWLKAAKSTEQFSADEAVNIMTVSHRGNEVVVYCIFWNVQSNPGGSKKLKIFTGSVGSMTSKIVNMPNNQTFQAVVTDKWDSKLAYTFANEKPFKVYQVNSVGSFVRDLTGNLPDIRKFDIVRHRTKPNTYYLATEMGMFVTFNNGAEWLSYQEGLPVVSVQRIAYRAGSQSDTLRIATFGRGFWVRSLEDGDSEFEIKHIDYNLTGVSAGFDLLSSGKVAIATCSEGRMLKSDDSFDSYTLKTTSFTNSNLNAVSMYRSGFNAFNSGAICGTNGLVATTTDRGENWKKISGLPSRNINDIHLLNNGKGFFCDDSGYVYKSINFGQNWTNMQKIPSSRMHSIKNYNDKVIITGGVSNINSKWVPTVAYSNDSGATFNLVELNFNETATGRVNDVSTPNWKSFAVGEWGSGIGSDFYGFVAKSTNSGNSWEVVSKDIPQRIYACWFSNEWEGWICGLNGYVGYTSDGGETWERLKTGVANRLNDITYSGGKLIVVGDKVILTKDVTITSVNDEISQSIENFEIFDCKPNPANVSTDFKLVNHKYDKFEIKLIDVMGRVVSTIYEGYLDAGEFYFSLNTEQLPSGTYYYTVVSQEQKKIKGVIVRH